MRAPAACASQSPAMTQVIVLGGGLAGLSAAHTVLEHGGRVLLLDKARGRREGLRNRLQPFASVD